MLILERFLPGLGWLEILLLGGYASFITSKMLDPGQSAKWRSRIWRLFSLVFFGQLILGLLGLDVFLMSGKLHLPIPALIVAGPIFRGEGLFMPILFASTLALVGPAWCSHLCYFGGLDDFASKRKSIPQPMPSWAKAFRWGILTLVILSAFLLRGLGVSGMVAVLCAAAFGIVGIALMIFWSRKSGYMAHCVNYCPIGLIANILGKLNPFRVKIGKGCTQCMACTTSCRYGALGTADILKGKVGFTCTLCGDCISSCKHGQLSYSFPGLKSSVARTFFIVLVVSIHAAFLGLARI